MKMPPRILFVGAHCDDVELLAGGLLARACFSADGPDAVTRVGVLVFSDHRGVVDEERACRARAEFRENVAWLSRESGRSIDDHTDLILPACRGAFEQRRGEIYAALVRLVGAYDLVVTHPDCETNQDHRQVATEAVRVFKAHASVLAGEFPNNDLGRFVPQVYVPLTPRELDAKVRMLGAYRSQDFGGRPYLDEGVVRALARVRGSQIRAEAAEAFQVAARLVLR